MYRTNYYTCGYNRILTKQILLQLREEATVNHNKTLDLL